MPQRNLTYDSADMALRGRIGAHRLHATHDSKEITQNARATFLARFEQEVDPDGTLPEAERKRRAEHARKAYFAQLARKSAKARSKKRAKHIPVVQQSAAPLTDAASAALEGGAA